MDAIELLTKDHRDVEDLFDRLSVMDDPDQKRDVFESLAQALAVHSLIERQHFYPAVKEKNTEALLRTFLEEHEAVETLLAKLLELDPDDEQFDQKLEVLQKDVEAHISEEEGRLFPAVRRMMTAEMLDDLGSDMLATREASSEIEPREAVNPEGVGAEASP